MEAKVVLDRSCDCGGQRKRVVPSWVQTLRSEWWGDLLQGTFKCRDCGDVKRFTIVEGEASDEDLIERV